MGSYTIKRAANLYQIMLWNFQLSMDQTVKPKQYQLWGCRENHPKETLKKNGFVKTRVEHELVTSWPLWQKISLTWMANDAQIHWLNSPFNAFSHIWCDWAPDRLWKRTRGVTHFLQGFLWLHRITQQQMFCQQKLKIAGRKRRGLVALGETWRLHNHSRFFSPGFTLIRRWEAFRFQQWHVELESEGKRDSGEVTQRCCPTVILSGGGVMQIQQWMDPRKHL